MTRMLEDAIAEARKLPEPEQDSIAALIMERIADDRSWDEKFARSQDQLARLADMARAEIEAGCVRSLTTPTS